MTINSNTQLANKSLELALHNLPITFRTRITSSYLSVREAFDEGNYDTTSLRVGKFCETILRFLQSELNSGVYTPFGEHIKNFTDECRKLEKLPRTAGSESFRIIIPRALDFAYTVRNKRGVGHAGGDIDANQIDAATVMRSADWVLCELMRFFHKMPIEDAQAILDAISTRQLPHIWTVGTKKRVLAHSLKNSEQVLVLLHAELASGVPFEDIKDWVEYEGRDSDFKRWVLNPLHKKRYIEFDNENDMVILSPTGAKQVEEHILPKL